MLKQFIFNIATPVVAALSVLCTPISASAAWNQSCCPPQDCCQQEDPCCKSGISPLWGLVGAAAVGAAAGAITAAAMDSGKGSRGRRGPTGPTGPGSSLAGPTGSIGAAGATGATGPGFAVVADEALVFNFNLTLALEVLAAGPIATFVQKPDGTVILGDPFSIAILGLLQSTSITISPTENGPVQIGTYHWGYVFPPALVTAGLTLADFVLEQPDGIAVIPDNIGVVGLQLLSTGETQYIHTFSFDVD